MFNFTKNGQLLNTIFKISFAFCFASACALTPTMAKEFENEVVLGQSAAFTGTSAGLGIELFLGSQAYFNKINQSGGVNGRKIKVITLDDGYIADKAQINTINLLTKHDVFCLFGYVGTPTLVKSLPVMQSFQTKDAFLFSNFTGAQPQREDPFKPFVFNVRASYREETKSIVNYFIKKDLKKIGVFIQDDSYGRSGASGVEASLNEAGLSIVAETTYHKGASASESMSEQVRILKANGVEGIISIASYSAAAAFIRDARAADLNVPIANVSFVGSIALLKTIEQLEAENKVALQNDLIVSQVVPLFDNTNIPLIKEFKNDIDTFRVDLPEDITEPNYKPNKYSFSILEGYINAKLFVEILKKVPEPLTKKKFIETAEGLPIMDIGLNEKIDFTKSDHQALHTVFLTTIKEGRYVDLQ